MDLLHPCLTPGRTPAIALKWIITGEAEGESQMSFLLKNPPRERLQRFEDLHRQLPAYERQRADLNEYLQRPVRTPYYETWGCDSSLPLINWKDQQAAIARNPTTDAKVLLQEAKRDLAEKFEEAYGMILSLLIYFNLS